MLGFPGAGGTCVPASGKLFPGAGLVDLNWMILISNTAKTWFHNADELQGWCHHAFLVFSVPKKVVSWRQETLLSGAGERSARRRG